MTVYCPLLVRFVAPTVGDDTGAEMWVPNWQARSWRFEGLRPFGYWFERKRQTEGNLGCEQKLGFQNNSLRQMTVILRWCELVFVFILRD
jgi:hypothetical protein